MIILSNDSLIYQKYVKTKIANNQTQRVIMVVPKNKSILIHQEQLFLQQ